MSDTGERLPHQVPPEDASAFAVASDLVNDPEATSLQARWQQFVNDHPDAAAALRHIANEEANGDTQLKSTFLHGFAAGLLVDDKLASGALLDKQVLGDDKPQD